MLASVPEKPFQNTLFVKTIKFLFTYVILSTRFKELKTIYGFFFYKTIPWELLNSPAL